MNFVDQVDFESPARWRILHIVQQVTGVLDSGARRSINLNQIDEPALTDFTAGVALPTGCRGNALLTIQAAGQYTRHCGFSNAPRACKQIGMMQTLLLKRMRQRLQNMHLSGHFREVLGAPFSGKYLVAHVSRSMSGD